MGQILSWIRGPRDPPALQDVAVEEQSQPSQTTPSPAAQVSTVKPAQFEKSTSGSAMATKPAVVATATGGATGSGVTAGGSASVGTAGKEAPKAKPETNPMLAGATVIDMSSTGATVVDMTSAGARDGPKEMSKTAPASQVKATATAPSPATGAAATSAVAKPKESPKDAVKSTTATTTVKAEVPKVDPAKASKPAAATAAAGNVSVQGKKEEAKQSQTKVQVEVPSVAAKGAKQAHAADPTDALSNLLPSTQPVTEPVYTGPEVIEPVITPERGQKCGERDDTLPPGYRLKDMAPVPADVKPKDDPKPLTTDQAMDSLLDDFSTSTAPKQESVVASSAGPANFAPPPVKKGETPVSPAPPADKKAKMEKVPDDSSLKAGHSSSSTKSAPPADKKAKLEKDDFSLKAGRDAKVETKHKTDEDDPLSLDALSALGDTLPKDKPKPESPKLKPKDIVSEEKLKKEKGVRVGERDDTLPPEYRFKEDELKKIPAPKPEPTIDTGDALDFLSEGFTTSSKASAVQAPVVSSSAAPAKKASVSPAAPADKKVESSAAPPVAVCYAHPVDKKDKKVPDVFSLEAGLSASTAKKVESSAAPRVAVCPAPPADKKAAGGKDATNSKHKKSQDDSLSLDALSALGDTLPEDKPKPESPKLRPEDIVSEDKLKKEKGVRVGERDDTLPPEYRFKEDDLKKAPAPKPEPSMDTGDALDFLSEGFTSSSAAPAVQSPVVQFPVQSKVEDLSALDVLSGDFVAPTKASGVQAQAAPSTQKTPEKTVAQTQQGKPKIEKGDSLSLDALSALGDTLPADIPKPESPKLRPEDIVSEDKLKKEKGVRVGERDDTLPPEYRFKDDLKKVPAPKPEPTMGTGEALDILSEGFTTSSEPISQPSADFALDALAGDFVAPTAAATVKSSACFPTQTAPQLEAGDDNALDALSDTLKDIKPAPKPTPVPAKDVVKEKKAVEEKLIKMGERDDSLPAEYRTTEEDRKKMAEIAKRAPGHKESMDDDAALDLLSGDFSAAPKTSQVTSSAEANKPMAGPVLDSLAGTLLPDTAGFKSDKPKKHQAEQPPSADQPSAKLSSDVVPTSAKKGGKS